MQHQILLRFAIVGPRVKSIARQKRKPLWLQKQINLLTFDVIITLCDQTSGYHSTFCSPHYQHYQPVRVQGQERERSPEVPDVHRKVLVVEVGVLG